MPVAAATVVVSVVAASSSDIIGVFLSHTLHTHTRAGRRRRRFDQQLREREATDDGRRKLEQTDVLLPSSYEIWENFVLLLRERRERGRNERERERARSALGHAFAPGVAAEDVVVVVVLLLLRPVYTYVCPPRKTKDLGG